MADARPWPARTVKGTDCRLYQHKGRGVFCHHHAEGGSNAGPGLNTLRLWRAFDFLLMMLNLYTFYIAGKTISNDLHERSSVVIPKTQAVSTAYHEAGHTLLAFKGDLIHAFHNFTIVPSGYSAGRLVLTTG